MFRLLTLTLVLATISLLPANADPDPNNHFERKKRTLAAHVHHEYSNDNHDHHYDKVQDHIDGIDEAFELHETGEDFLEDKDIEFLNKRKRMHQKKLDLMEMHEQMHYHPYRASSSDVSI
jgi:hypothetical protein